MKKIYGCLNLLFFSVVCLCSLYNRPVWAGTISGHVECKGVKSNQWVVIYVDVISGKEFSPSAQPVVMDQKGKEFIPHVLPVLKGTTVEFLNDDPFAHNVFSPDEAADAVNLGSWGQGEKKPHTFNKLGEAVMLCNLHPEMEGWIVVLPTPYFAVTDANGDYAIDNVPEGTYTLKTWHQKLAPSQSEATVVSGGTAKVDFTLKK
ncbi:MAG: carboxypeptidase regulatory-like domain-containing protein [Candidatus Omnitrophica bacterium]|nr:carboxypeptidase regulatory-like domain-containing protein [Candidatus Omnitrophota bacterium]